MQCRLLYGDRPALVNAIAAAIKKGGLFAVDVDIVPTKIGPSMSCLAASRDRREANLTSMNGERRMRLTERYMDPPRPGDAGLFIAARIANHMERVLREQGKNQQADQFKGFDWKTGRRRLHGRICQARKGGEFVTYARLRAMGTNGFVNLPSVSNQPERWAKPPRQARRAKS
jgi:arsenite oxidase large subunit